MGRVIAEISDYAIAVQFIGDSFMDSIGENNGYTKKRIKIIEKHGMISSKNLAKVTGVSVAAISQWTKPLIEKGVLMWVDQDGGVFPDDKSLEKAKRSGKAFIKVSQFNRLPTPFELTNDDRWDIEGEFYKRFDLQLGDKSIDNFDMSEVEEESYNGPESSDLFDFVERPNVDADAGNSSVKVLSDNMAPQIKSSKIKGGDVMNLDGDVLFNEFQHILSPENAVSSPEKGNGRKRDNLPPGILTI
jgi:hypothetical protein